MTSYHFKTRPYPHQVRALRFLLKRGGGGLQVPMRWGKTKVAIDFANCLALTTGCRRVLVLCPLSVVGVWMDEIERHQPDDSEVEWLIANYEKTYSSAWPELRVFKADLVIVDESHRIGNPGTASSKQAFKLGRAAKHRLIMTGTMFHRKPFYVFGQAKFYDPGIFGTAFTSFKNRIAVFGGYGGYEIIGYRDLKWMMKQMRTFVFIEKYVPPRDTAVNVLHFNLTGGNLRHYAEMEKDSITVVKGRQLISPIVLSRHLRCQQIAGGWVKIDGKYAQVGDDKERLCRERFKEYAEQDIQKIVVGCRFLPELKCAARAARAAGYNVVLLHGAVPQAERDSRRHAFQTATVPTAFVAQIHTGSEGIDLSSASVMMFYSLSESYVKHDQFSKRIEKYDEQRVLMYDYLVARGTRDEVTFAALQLKKDVATFLIENPTEVERIVGELSQGKANRRRIMSLPPHRR